MVDDLGNSTDEIKDDFKKGAEKFKEKAKGFAKDLDENTQDFQQEAKSTANEFTKGAKNAYEDLTSNKGNKKIIAGILAIIFGSLGAHKFILGYTKEGLIMLGATFILAILSFGLLAWLVGLIGFIEGIIYLTKSDEEFYQTYQMNQKSWF
ncbi:MAG: NINE protein [Flavobacteriaceae bacterium]|nr:NINE protein [Flavobacteriaceae bacterium]